MKAAICWKPGTPLEVDVIDLDGPRPGECLVRRAATGVCHTDAYTTSGYDPEGLFPVVLGCEDVGVVESAVPPWHEALRTTIGTGARQAPGRPRSKREDQRMKIYDFVGAPNPKKLRVYLAEKGIRVPYEAVDIVSGQNRKPEFLKKNPMGGLPVLELDDGSSLSESLAIIEYFEDLHPTPPMIGTTPLERARVRSLERMAELSVLSRIATIFQNTHPFMAGRLKQSADAAENARAMLAAALKVLDGEIGTRPFVAGERPTIADCTLFAALEFGEFAQVPLDPACTNVARWYTAFKERPSAAA